MGSQGWEPLSTLAPGWTGSGQGDLGAAASSQVCDDRSLSLPEGRERSRLNTVGLPVTPGHSYLQGTAHRSRLAQQGEAQTRPDSCASL